MATIGSSDLDVLPIALGTNTLGWTADRAQSFEILDAYTEGGGSLIDTADVYSAWAEGNSGGESETLIGEWIAARAAREKLVISTKVAMHPEFKGLSAANVAAAARKSLQRLQTDHIDLYFAHEDDPNTALEETILAFDELIKAGVVRHVGLSNFTPERVTEWLATAEHLNAKPPVALQPHYNLLHREPFESELRPVAEQHDLGVLPYFGLAAGFLTGKYRSKADAEGVARGGMVGSYLTDSGFDVAAAVREIAEARGVDPAAVALAWLRSRPTIAAPIGGATRPEQVAPLLAAATLELDAAELGRLEQVSSAFQPA